MADDIIRNSKPGEASLVVHFYYKLFEEQFAFLPHTEQYFLHAMEDLFGDADGNRLFVAEQDGQIVGSVCIAKLGPHEAQLRMFGIWGQAQGKGLGKKLMVAAMAFCAQRGYHHVCLWTADICQAARHLYGKYGFEMTDTKPNTDWARYPMMEEKWEYSDAVKKQTEYYHASGFWKTIL